MFFNFRPDIRVPGFRVGLPDEQEDLPLSPVPPGFAPSAWDYDPAATAMQTASPSIFDLIASSPYLARPHIGGPDPTVPGGPSSGPVMPLGYAAPSWWAAILPPMPMAELEPAGQFSLQSSGGRPAPGGDAMENGEGLGVGTGTSSGNAAPTPASFEPLSWSKPQSQGNDVTAVRYAPGEGPGRTDRADAMTPGSVPMIPGADGPPSSQARLRIDRSPGNVVVLPDGSDVPDPDSVTGKLMSPVSDLNAVAAAGRRVGSTYLSMLRSPEGGAGALPYLATMLGVNVGHAGTFDYQRRGNMISGYTHLPQFANVSNVNVGLFCQQAGLTLDETLWIAGRFACNFSSNAKPGEPYCLHPDQLRYITKGYQLGQSGVFGQPAAP